MNRQFRVIAVLALCLFALGCKNNPERHFNLGNWYYQKGLVDDAILEYREVIRLHPLETRIMEREEINLLAKAHYNLANTFFALGEYREAITNFNEV